MLGPENHPGRVEHSRNSFVKNSEYLVNSGQNQVNPEIRDFCRKIGDIKTVEDLANIDKAIVSYLDYDPTTPKFERSVIEIFNSKTYAGCSDIGLFTSTLLREKGVPTVYVETAGIDWVKTIDEGYPNKSSMHGHIFLEVFINDEWYLYDPTHRCYYLNYDPTNDNYPDNYYVFSKDLNYNNHGVFNVDDEVKAAFDALKDFDANSYTDPNYEKVSLKDK